MHCQFFGVKVWALNIEKKIRRETLQDLAPQGSDLHIRGNILELLGKSEWPVAEALPRKVWPERLVLPCCFIHFLLKIVFLVVFTGNLV